MAAERRDVMELEAVRKRPRLMTPSPSPADSSKALDDENLLWEIIRRIRDPPSLVRASLVRKNWYRICSDSKIVDDLCMRQPRRLLGYFAMFEEGEMEFFMFKQEPERAGITRFLSVSFPLSISQDPDRRSCGLEEVPELACVSRFLSSTFPEGPCNAEDYCNNGHVLLKFGNSLAICHPLRQTFWMLPPLLPLPYWGGIIAGEYFLLSEDGLSTIHVTATWMENNFLGVDVACLNGNKWIHDASNIELEQQFPAESAFCHPALLVNGCIFMLTTEGCMIKVNLEGCEISIIDLPTAAWAWHEWGPWGSHKLCRAQGTDLLYVHADGYNIQIWLYSQGVWTRQDTIVLPTVFAHSNISWTPEDRDDVITIYGVGDAAEFIFLGVSDMHELYILDVGSCIAVKIGEKTSKEKCHLLGNRIIPFVTSWPIVFPQMREDKISIKPLENAIAEGNEKLINQLLAISMDEQSLKNFIKTRYTFTSNLIWSIDDCLTILHSVAALPDAEVGTLLHYRISSCRRLTQQWGKYIMQTNSLSKKVTSVNGVYFQAEVSGQTVTWRSPLAAQVAGDYFGFNFPRRLLMFYGYCLMLLLKSLNNRAGTYSEKRDIEPVLLPNFQYSETIKRLRSVSDVLSLPGMGYNLESNEKVKEEAECVGHAIF